MDMLFSLYTHFIDSVTEGIRKRTKLNQEEQTMKKKHVLRLLAAAVTMGMLAGTVSCGNAGQNDSQESSQAEKEKKEEPEQESGDEEESDMVFRGGTILTMLSEDDMDNSAVAVKDGEIVYVGDEEGIEKYISDETEVIDLDGQTLMPGFIDRHFQITFLRTVGWKNWIQINLSCYQIPPSMAGWQTRSRLKWQALQKTVRLQTAERFSWMKTEN